MSVLAIVSVLAAYPFEEVGSFSYNSQFETHLYETSNGSFCALTTAPGSTTHGLDYRLAISFGDRNEIRLVTENPLPKLEAMRVSFDDGSEFDLLDIKHEQLPGRSAAYTPVSRSMMSKFLQALKGGGGMIELVLPAGAPAIALPRAERAEAWEGVRACERHRLGQVAPD